MVESENNIFQSSFLEKQRSLWISWGYWYFPLNERAEFLVILGLQKPVLYSGNCMSTSTRHVTLKSPLLLQFPNCELGDNDNRQSNYTLMFCAVQKPYFPVLANLQSNKPREKETLHFPIKISPTCFSLNEKFTIPTENLETCLHFSAFLINHLV